MNIGERVGDYEIIQVLGAGGMGQVYKVRNTLSERVEAMKVLLPKLEGEQGLADRFLREIKTQATFDHPNIAKLYTAMRVDDQLLMFMEFVDGVSLAKELEKGPLAPGEAAAYTAQVLDALAYAHGRGVVHRDIKPANIMITDAGVAKLMDFGIARVEADTRLTQTGNAVGSLAYMSPEQINGSTPDPRSDIYSLGITLYEMVTGKRPFGGDSGYSIMSAHLKQTPVAPIELTPGLPPDLSDIILMAIAKDPAGRFQSATAFRGALVSVFPGIAAPLRSHDSTQTMPLGVPIAAKVPAATSTAATVTRVAVPPAPMATPAPVPMTAAAPLPPSTVTTSGRRGIYMALGSVVTLAVLVAAVIEGPKLMHGGLSDAFGKGTRTPAASTPPSAPQSAPASDAASASTTTPDATAPATASDTGTPAPAASSASAAAASASAAASNTTPAAPVAAVPPVASAKSSSAPTATASAQAVGKTRGAQPASADRLPQAPAAPATPSQSAQNFAPAPSPAPAPQAAPATPPPPAVNPELAELRQKFNETSIRASTARNGLNSFQQQQARQGLGLRADIREAQTRMDYQLQEATAYLQRGDIENARTSLRYAQNAVETIEKFLGR